MLVVYFQMVSKYCCNVKHIIQSSIVRNPSTAQVDYKQYLFFSIVHCEYERDLHSNEHHFDSSNILLSYTHSHLFATSWIYLEPVWPAPNWLVSLGGRALHWYCRGHRFKSCTGLNFLSGLIFTTAQVVFITGRITFIFTSLSTVQIYDFHVFTVVYCPLYEEKKVREKSWFQCTAWRFGGARIEAITSLNFFYLCTGLFPKGGIANSLLSKPGFSFFVFGFETCLAH